MSRPPAGPPRVAANLFGDRLPGAVRYAELLAGSGAERGLIGPQEAERVWERHLLNSAVVGELIPPACRVVDLGSGAGLPGIPLALARTDLTVTLLEPMARRVEWLLEVLDELGLALRVVRGRAEERVVRDELAGAEVVTARAVAPLGRLAGWAVPLLGVGGRLLAMKGSSAREEIERDAGAVSAAGGTSPELRRCGAGLLDPPTSVVVVGRAHQRSRKRKDRRT